MKQKIFGFLLCVLGLMASSECLAAGAPSWSDYTEPITKGTGTMEEPFLIETPEQLAWFALEVNRGNSYENKVVALASDINLNKVVDGERVYWNPIGTREDNCFKGLFLGLNLQDYAANGFQPEQKHKITGMYIDVSQYNGMNFFGLFGFLGGNVSHLQLEDISINIDFPDNSFANDIFVGGLCGRTMDSNVESSEIIYRGAFREANETNQNHYVTFAIDDVSVNGSIAVSSHKNNSLTIAVGGICGRFDNLGILHSTFNGSITTTNCRYVGGICGIDYGHYDPNGYGYGKCLYDCATNATITCNNNYDQDLSDIDKPVMVGGIAGQIEYKNSAYACVSTGSIRCKYSDSRYNLYNVGGICGNLQPAAGIYACGSTMFIKAFGNVGGIVGIITSGTDTSWAQYSKVECCSFGGHLDGSRRIINEKGETTGYVGTNPNHNYIGGICGNLEWNDNNEHITRCLLLGTITIDDFVNDVKPSAIVGKTGENIASTVTYCYYDTNLYNGNAIPGSMDGRQSVKGLSTEELTSANASKLPWLNAGDTESEDYGFRLEKGYYPIFYENRGRSATYYVDYSMQGYFNNNLKKLFDFIVAGAVNKNSTVYAPGALLCSMPANFVKGDCAGDFVSTMSAPTKTYSYSEKETGRDIMLTSESFFPETSVITVKDKTASAYDKGSCFVTTTSTVRKKTVVLNRPAIIPGTKYWGLNCTVGQTWNGSEADAFAAGTGTAADPYLIKNASQLLHAIKTNNEGQYYKQMCDIRINVDTNDRNPTNDGTSLLTKANLLAIAPAVYYSWTTNGCEWKANYNGNGHSVNGLFLNDYTDVTESGQANQYFSLFGNVAQNGSINNLAVVDTWIDLEQYADAPSRFGVIAGLVSGTISNCMTQGISVAGRPSGGICGNVSGGKVQDCVSAVFPYTTTLDQFTPFVAGDAVPNTGSVEHCLYVTPTTYSSADRGTGNLSCLNNCYWLKGYEPNNSGYTLEEIGEALGSRGLWTWKEGYFPMLSTFAETEIGKLLTIPVRTDKGFEYDSQTKIANNYLLGFTKMLEFEPGSMSWSNIHGAEYIEADGELGVVAPISTMISENYFVVPSLTEAIWTKLGKTNYFIPMRTSADNVESGITFVDSHAEAVCVEAFDSNHDGRLSLTELRNVTTDQTLNAFNNATGRQIEQFPEFRFFKSVTTLTSQLNGLTNLTSVRLPYNLEAMGNGDAAPFSGCDNLTSVTIPGKVTSVGAGAFYGSSVENIYVDPFNAVFVSRDGILFNNSNRLISYPNGRSGEEIIIPGVIDEIAEGAVYKVPGARKIFFDTNDYTTVADLETDGIVSDNGELMDVYISDATYGSVLYNDYLDDDSWDDYASSDKLHCYYPLKIGSAKASTMYIGFDTELPDGLSSYIVASDSYDEKVAYLQKTSNLIPNRSPIVIFANEPGTYRLFPLDEVLEPWKMYENKLNGVGRDGMEVYQSDSDRGSILTLGRNSAGVLGFFYYKGTAPIAPYRAYLTYEWTTADPSKAFLFFSFLEDEPSGITRRHGLDVNDSHWYTIDGCRLHTRPYQRGVYIYGGKKVVVGER